MAGADTKLQLFGIAFAGADLGFEIDRAGKVVFALGAVTRLTGLANEAFMGSDWLQLFEEEEVEMLAVMARSIKASERCGPLRVKLKRSFGARLARYAALSMFRLPREDGAVSCVLSLGAPGAVELQSERSDGLIEQHAFAQTAGKLLEEAEEAGLPIRMELVELKGFAASGSAMDPAAAAARKRRLGAALRAASYGGLGAAEMADDRFALLRSADASAESLREQLGEVAPGLTPVTSSLALGDADTAGQNLRAMRYALDRFIEDGPLAAEAGFKTTVERTLRETARFKAILAEERFFLAYQPVVDVHSGEVHHYEALARFDPNASPGDTIRLAEELNLIADFDKAVFKNVAAALKAGDPGLKISVNLSAVSLMQKGFLDWLDALPLGPEERPRMPIEITESKEISDLGAANIVLKAIRRRGHPICIDDFGCGGASLDYLRRLECDVVKFDGRYVQGLTGDRRNAIMLKHLVALCQELKLETIAEMIETPDVAAVVKSLGVDYGQGWHYGRPTAEPKISSEEDKSLPARRVGEVSEWR